VPRILCVQACALGLFFDEMVNTFDPDALIVGGGAIGEDDNVRLCDFFTSLPKFDELS
jgi:hypothetical protein